MSKKLEEAKPHLAKIPRTLLLFPQKMKKKVEDGKFNKFMDILK